MKLDLEKLARDIATMAYNASSVSLVGTGPQCVHDLRKRFEDIQPGDLVVETTTCLMDGRRGSSGPKFHRPALDAVGYLIKITWEPIVFEGDPEFAWDDAVEGKPHPTEKCVYIRTLDGREFRWTNASFVSAPTEWPMRGIPSRF